MTLPRRRDRLRTFVSLKTQNRRLRIASALLFIAAAVLAVALALQPAPKDEILIGEGRAGVEDMPPVQVAQAAEPTETALPAAETPVETAAAEPAAPASGEPAGAGSASYYGNELAGNPTASGEPFDPARMTAAHRSLPLGSRVRVTHERSGESVIVRINDRGPFHGNRIIDLSEAAARQLGMLRSGTARVQLELLTS